MIKRYAVDDIEKIWDDENKIQNWWLVEYAILQAWNKLKVISDEDLQNIKNKVKISLSRMLELEEETKHDVVAFTRMISESLGEESRWVHLGVTSTDIVDSAQNLMIKNSLEILISDLEKLNLTIYNLATMHKKTLIMGRSHGIFGEPTSLGLKFLLWHCEIKRQITRIKYAFMDTCVTKISGSMGNFANVPIELENIVAETLNMPVDLVSTQVSQRDRMAFLLSSIANLASTFEKISTEIRLYNRSEVKEISEGFSKNQKGSSSMPHKKNPISSENISGLSRMIRSYAIPGFENNVLWHERDISHSSVERIILPDVFNLSVYIARRLNNVIGNLFINKEQMLNNINSANNIFYSQLILTEIIKKTNFSREEAYDFIQECTTKSMSNNLDFLVVLENSGVDKYLKIDELKSICNLEYFIRNVEDIFTRIIK